MVYCRLIYMLSILCVRLTIKVKVGIPDSFKVGWHPRKKLGRVTFNLVFMIRIFFRWSVFYGVFDSFTDRPCGNVFLFITYLKPLPLNGKEHTFDFLYIRAASRGILFWPPRGQLFRNKPIIPVTNITELVQGVQR